MSGGFGVLVGAVGVLALRGIWVAGVFKFKEWLYPYVNKISHENDRHCNERIDNVFAQLQSVKEDVHQLKSKP